MSGKNKTRLQKAYLKFRTTKKKSNVLAFFNGLIPEIVFRTTKLEGEPVTRKMVTSLLKWSKLQQNQKAPLHIKKLSLGLSNQSGC